MGRHGDELLVAALRASGESTIKGTVLGAPEMLVAESLRSAAELRERWASLGVSLADLQDDAVMRQAWS